jgi:hypothetical protein
MIQNGKFVSYAQKGNYTWVLCLQKVLVQKLENIGKQSPTHKHSECSMIQYGKFCLINPKRKLYVGFMPPECLSIFLQQIQKYLFI